MLGISGSDGLSAKILHNRLITFIAKYVASLLLASLHCPCLSGRHKQQEYAERNSGQIRGTFPLERAPARRRRPCIGLVFMHFEPRHRRRMRTLYTIIATMSTEAPTTAPHPRPAISKKKKRAQAKRLKFGSKAALKRGIRRFAGHNRNVSDGAAVYLSAVMGYLATECLELAGNAAKQNKKKRIQPRHLTFAVRGDRELDRVVRGHISAGGVVPYISPALLPAKKNKLGKKRKSKKSKGSVEDEKEDSKEEQEEQAAAEPKQEEK